MPHDPLATLARLRRLEVTAAQRSLAEARDELAARQASAAAHEAALRAERPDDAPGAYGAFLARGLEQRKAHAAATRRAEVATEAAREALVLARGAERVIGILRERRAAAARREAARQAQTRLEEAVPRSRD